MLWVASSCIAVIILILMLAIHFSFWLLRNMIVHDDTFLFRHVSQNVGVSTSSPRPLNVGATVGISIGMIIVIALIVIAIVAMVLVILWKKNIICVS